MNTGIFGGTFNPIHLAHLQIAREAQRRCRLDRVLFLPAADPPHKPVAGEVSFADRLAMVQAAVAEDAGFVASDLENRRSGKSYSVETLEILRREAPGEQLFFIIGLDSFRDLPHWKDYARLFTLAHLVVISRPGIEQDPRSLLPVAIREQFCYDAASENLCHRSGNSVIFLTETRLDISSTQIRERLHRGESIAHLVPPAVADYISLHRLYRPERRD